MPIDDLFNQQYDQYRQNNLILPAFQLEECRHARSGGVSVEPWLTERWEAIEKKGEKTKKAECVFFGRLAFYMWHLLSAVSRTYGDDNLCCILLRKLRVRDEEFGLISFYYDTLLDQAVRSVYTGTLQSIDDYLNFGLVKPHGGGDWPSQWYALPANIMSGASGWRASCCVHGVRERAASGTDRRGGVGGMHVGTAGGPSL